MESRAKGVRNFMDGFGKQEGNQHPEAADSRGQTKNPQGAEGGFFVRRHPDRIPPEAWIAC